MLDISKKKVLIHYMLATLLCIIINYIYLQFSHNVSSNYMTYMFIYPLLSIIIVLFVKITRNFRLLFSLGIYTLVLGSLLNGIFEIAGTTSNFVIIFYILGILLLICSFIKR